MSYIEQFKAQSEKQDSVQYMRRIQAEIAETLKNAPTEKPNPHLVQQTLSKFVRNLPQFDTNTSWLELAFLCWGVNTPITNFPESSILRSEIAFQTLQKLIRNAEQRGTFSAYLWQGLWLAFLNFNDRQSHVALKNWKILRQNLHDSFKPLLATMAFLPYWLDAIERHPIISR